jgi:hypothetical protein
MTMYVVKRDGRKEPVRFDKITARINKLSYGLNPHFCDPVSWVDLNNGHSTPPAPDHGLPNVGIGGTKGGGGRVPRRDHQRAG